MTVQKDDQEYQAFVTMICAMQLRQVLNDIDGDASEITTADVLEALATLGYTLDRDENNPAAMAYVRYLADKLAYNRDENETLLGYSGDYDDAFGQWFNDFSEEDGEE